MRLLDRVLDEYVALERRVQPVASGACAPQCATCRDTCCAARYCEESWTAPWLVAIHQRAGGASRREVGRGHRPLEGHLATDGCRLRFGRPPVCYEYACHDVLYALPAHRRKYLFRVISHVMSFAGEEALPGTHLVEVQDLRALTRSRLRRLVRRIALAGRIFDAALRLFARPDEPGDPSDWAVVRRHFPTTGYRLSEVPSVKPLKTPAPRPASKLQLLPVVRLVAVAAAALLLALSASACGPTFRHGLDSPAVPTHQDPAGFRIDARPEAPLYTLNVEVKNDGAGDLRIDWRRARFVDPEGREHAVFVWTKKGDPHTLAHLESGPAMLVVPPGQAVKLYVHAQDAVVLGDARGTRASRLPQLPDEDLTGKTVGLDLPIESPPVPPRHLALRFALRSEAASK